MSLNNGRFVKKMIDLHAGHPHDHLAVSIKEVTIMSDNLPLRAYEILTKVNDLIFALR